MQIKLYCIHVCVFWTWELWEHFLSQSQTVKQNECAILYYMHDIKLHVVLMTDRGVRKLKYLDLL